MFNAVISIILLVLLSIICFVTVGVCLGLFDEKKEETADDRE